MTQTPIRECDRCGGTGWTPSAKVTGAEMRFLRQQRGVSGAWVAAEMMPPVTRAYVSLLERGDAPWTPELCERYRRALDKAHAPSRDGAQQRGK